jgi:hypothetical protein
VPLETVRALLQALQPGSAREAPSATAADLPARAAAALLPVAVEADTAGLAERLRQAVRGSGAFLEARLAASPGAGRGDLSAVADDVRVILGELAARTAAMPKLETTRAALAADALARQAEVAYHAVRDGEIRLDVPVMLGTSPAEVRLRVREEGEPREGESAAPGRQIDLTLEAPEFGRVRATLAWTPGHLSTRFAVAGDGQAAALKRELAGLDARLRAIGFRQVASRVDVDPAALAPIVDPPDPLPPGGSILHVRA